MESGIEINMENKVYYGEFTLKYWLELMLKSEITMPDYQRRFVWSEEQVRKLIVSLQNKEFVPPVVIGSCVKDGQQCNYIIDGQQRLTAVLLASIGFFPDIQKWESIEENKLEDAVDYEEDKEDDLEPEGIKWRFPVLFSGITRCTLENIKESCQKSGKYKVFVLGVNDDFFANTYLGFSYIVPKDDDETKQHKYYSTIFRNINIQGKDLQAEESREALYFWNATKTYWFKPKFADSIKGYTIKGTTKMDFVRYVSILSEYDKAGKNRDMVCRGARFNLEEYYEEYIYTVANNRDEKFSKFTTLFGTDDDAKNLLSIVERNINELRWQEERYDTIIKMDLYFFGLFYYILFTKQEINIAKKEELKKELEEKWRLYDERHKRSPKAKKYLRQRLADSLEIYEKYLIVD